MAGKFFMDLGETFARTAKELGDRAENAYGKQKMKNKIATEKRAVEKMMLDLGKMLYKAYVNGENLSKEQQDLCEQIAQRKKTIDAYQVSLDAEEGVKFCSGCGKKIAAEALFCPHCGMRCEKTLEFDLEEDIIDVEREIVTDDSEAEEVIFDSETEKVVTGEEEQESDFDEEPEEEEEIDSSSEKSQENEKTASECENSGTVSENEDDGEETV